MNKEQLIEKFKEELTITSYIDGKSRIWRGCPTSTQVIEWLTTNLPEPLKEISEGEVGFCLYKELRGCGEELAREEWTAKHSNNECKHKAVVLAKTITAKFGLLLSIFL